MLKARVNGDVADKFVRRKACTAFVRQLCAVAVFFGEIADEVVIFSVNRLYFKFVGIYRTC